tara:strand:- start:838 stop:1095 length:258 start_codon:yes stop_codon:yes gene_type:complete
MNDADRAALELSDKLRKDLLDLCGFYYVANTQLSAYEKAIREIEELIGEALASLSLTTFETEKLIFTRFGSELLIEEKGEKCALH